MKRLFPLAAAAILSQFLFTCNVYAMDEVVVEDVNAQQALPEDVIKIILAHVTSNCRKSFSQASKHLWYLTHIVTNHLKLVVPDDQDPRLTNVKFFLDRCPNLTSLGVATDITIDFSSIAGLTCLTKLKTSNNPNITSDNLTTLTRLTELDLSDNTIINSDALMMLTNLTSLKLDNNDVIDENTLIHFAELKKLSLSCNNKISGSVLSVCTNLIELDLTLNEIITDESVSLLTSLTCLTVCGAEHVSEEGIMELTALQKLCFSINDNLPSTIIFSLPNLKKLKFYNDESDVERVYLRHLVITQTLFSMIDDREDLKNRGRVISLKSSYQNRVLKSLSLRQFKENFWVDCPREISNFCAHDPSVGDAQYLNDLVERLQDPARRDEINLEDLSELEQLISDLFALLGTDFTVKTLNF